MHPNPLTAEGGDAAVIERWLEEARQTGQTTNYAGKRQPLRYSWDAALEIHFTTKRGRVETYHATARDMSAEGIGFQCRQAIPAFIPVKICLAGEPTGVTAVVTHCTPALVGHVVGAKFNMEPDDAGNLRVLKVG